MWTDRLRCPSVPETISCNTHPPTQMLHVLSIPMRTMSSHVEFRQKTSLRFICNLNFLLCQFRKTYTLHHWKWHKEFAILNTPLPTGNVYNHSVTSEALLKACLPSIACSRPFAPPSCEAGHPVNSYGCISEQYVWDKGVFQKQLP